MLQRLLFWFVLFGTATPVAVAQNSLLGVDYSELVPSPFTAISAFDVGPVLAVATDAQGSVYILADALAGQPSTTQRFLTKLNPAGNRILYQNVLSSQPNVMVVDPAGNVYLAGGTQVQKLGADGKTIAFSVTIAPDAEVAGLAIDATGRAYITGWTASGDLATTSGALQQTPPPGNATDMFVVRLTTTGAVDYATYVGGASQGVGEAIAVDAAGSAFVTGAAYSAAFPTTPGAYLDATGIPNFGSASFLARLSPDGSSLVYSTFTDSQNEGNTGVAVDASGDAVVSFQGIRTTVVLRFNLQGTALLFSKVWPASYPEGVASDAAGNTYLALSASGNFPVRNSVAPCTPISSSVLAVLDPSGMVLQATYIPGAVGLGGALALGPNSTVDVLNLPATGFTPARQIVGPATGFWLLTRFSNTATAQPVQLACMANAASYDTTGVSGGELVSLFGEGIGPASGAQPQVDVQTGFPKQLAYVQVTFNGTPAPLLYVQDNQINAIAPWSLPTGQTVPVCVVYNGNTTNCISSTVLGSHPGVFTVDGSYAATLNQDGTLNTTANPAPVGSIVSVFATGLGPVTPQQPDGAIVGLPLPTDVLPAEVYWFEDTFLIGTIASALDLRYAGPAPFEVAGVSQINFAVSDTNNLGSQSPVYLQVGPASFGGFVQPGASNGFLIHVAPQ